MLLCLLAGLVSSGCAGPDQYEVRIRRTSFGIPHIEARDVGSLGFGEGYAQAEDHICSIADQVVRARGERARYFGRGKNDRHLNSDVTMRGLQVRDRASEQLSVQHEDFRDWIDGFAAGYNYYLAETGKDSVPSWCRGEDWVVPISADDLMAYAYMFILSSTYFTDAIASAEPPEPDQPSARIHEFPAIPLDQASNGWSIGRDLSESGRGLLVANPHYPWVGSNRFWEKHLTIPGELDVYGANLVGIAGVAIGFNEAVAWTHTVSAGERFTFYLLDLVAGKPTRYLFGDAERDMTSRTVSVDVLQEDGSLEPVERTMYFSHHGPVLSFPGVGWNDEQVIAMRDANWENDEAWPQWYAMNRAPAFDDFVRAHARLQGMPFINTIAVSAEGRAWYADTASTPNVLPEVLADWKQRRGADDLVKRLWNRGIVLLDGSDPASDWIDDPAARDPGVVPFSAMPQLERADYVFNANDSYWLANSAELITGPYSLLHGEQETARSLRTRNNDLALSNRSADPPAGDDGKFSVDEALGAILSNRSHAAALIKPALVEQCRKRPFAGVDGARVDLREACRVLASWDGHYNLDSRGAVLFREFIGNYNRADLRRKGKLFAVAFDPENPIVTPRGLANSGQALENLGRAVKLLESRRIALDVPLGDLQYTDKAGRRIPIHGGNGSYEGLLNLQQRASNNTTLEPMENPEPVEGSRFLTEEGYPIATGTSFLLGVEYTADGPRAKGILTYSQSGDPKSVHFTDQTELFSKKQLREVWFREEDIAADTQRDYTIRAPR